MQKIIPVLAVLVFFASCSKSPEPKEAMNVLLICIDDLRPELNSFGASYIHSPNIDQLAQDGRAFMHHYVNAPSCGPSRYTLLTGRYGPPANDALFIRSKEVATNPESVPPSMPEWFRQNGYFTVSVGKVSHHPGGRGGKDWNDSTVIEIPNAWDRHLMPVGEWQHPRGAMHGLAHGEIRITRGEMDLYQAVQGSDTIYPDGLIVNEALKQLEELAGNKKQAFFLAVGVLKPHLPFGVPKKYLDLYEGVEMPPIPHPNKPEGTSTWHGSGEFMSYDRWGKDPNTDSLFATEVRRHYAACVSYSDAHVGLILDKLKATGADKNTIVILWGDHGWHLGEHAIWGKHSLFEEALHSPLIISYPGIEKPGKNAEGVVETMDIFPTLCDLTGLAKPEFAQGTSLQKMLEKPDTEGHTASAYRGGANTIRTNKYRLTIFKNGDVGLYDHSSPLKETLNIAYDNPEIVEELRALLEERIALKND